jgi:hypothetical protein
VTTDPTPFLATVVGTSVTLAAIVGGLPVARFVSIDSDQRTSRKVLADARERLSAARDRAAAAWHEILDWDADDFFWSLKVVDAIDRGVTAPRDLMRLEDWEHSEDDLRPYAEQAAAEQRAAREVLPTLVTQPGEDWDDFRRASTDLPPIRWLRLWEHVYEEITVKLAAEEEARRKAELARAPLALRMMALADSIDTVSPVTRSMLRAMNHAGMGDVRATAARRYDGLVTAHQVALQQVEDYEGELRRLEADHAEVVRPDSRLWWGVGIVAVFAVVGVALPVWIMAQGPKDLATVRWLYWPFAAALAALLAYIVVYLAQLTRAKPSW